MEDTNKMTCGNYKWGVLAMTYTLMLAFTISLQSIPPMLGLIMDEIRITYSMAGMLIGAYAVPGIILPIAIGILAHRYDPKKLVIIALGCMLLGVVLFGASNSFWSLLGSRLIAGIGATVIVVLSPFLVTLYFDKAKIGTAMGLFNTSVPVGTVVSINLFAYVAKLVGWRLSVYFVAIFLLVCLLMVVIFLKSSDDENSKKETVPKERTSIGSGIWHLAIIWMITNAMMIAYVTFASGYFQSLGIASEKSRLLTSFIVIITIIAGPLVGLLIDKIKQKEIMLVFSSLIMATSLIFISKGSNQLYFWAVFLGLGVSFVPITVFSLLTEILRPNQMGYGLGIATVALNLGNTLGPMIFGWILDAAGSYYFGFQIFSGIIIFIIPVVLNFIRTEKKKSGTIPERRQYEQI